MAYELAIDVCGPLLFDILGLGLSLNHNQFRYWTALEGDVGFSAAVKIAKPAKPAKTGIARLTR